MWSKTSYSGDKRPCYRGGTTNNEQTMEDSATQLMEARRLRFAIRKKIILLMLIMLMMLMMILHVEIPTPKKHWIGSITITFQYFSLSGRFQRSPTFNCPPGTEISESECRDYGHTVNKHYLYHWSMHGAASLTARDKLYALSLHLPCPDCQCLVSVPGFDETTIYFQPTNDPNFIAVCCNH